MAKLLGSDRTHIAETGGYWHDSVQEFSVGWGVGKFLRVTGGGDFTAGTGLFDANNNGTQWEILKTYADGCIPPFTGTSGGVGYVSTIDYYVFFVGNSITAQTGGASIANADMYHTVAMSTLDIDAWRWGIYGSGGATVADLTGKPIAAGLAPGGQNVAVLFEARNSLASGIGNQSAAACYADILTWCDHAIGLGYLTVVATCKPDPDVDETRRLSLNALINANADGKIDAVWNVAGVAEAAADTSIHFDATVHAAIAPSLRSAIQGALGLSSVSIAITETTLERGASGQTLHITLTDATSSSAADFTLTGSTVTALSSAGATPILTVTAASSNGVKTLTHVPSGATTTITVEDTVSPSAPSPSIGDVAAYAFVLSWDAVPASPSGETVTYTVYQNATLIVENTSDTSCTIEAAQDGDVFTVTANDGTNNSEAAPVTFHPPAGGNTPITEEVRDFDGNLLLTHVNTEEAG